MIATFTLNDFKLTTTSTDTKRTVTAYFTVPAHTGINSASLSYVTLDTYGGNTQDAALYLDSTVRAHDNSFLAPGGKALLTSIFTPGQHSYRFHLKSTTSASNTWQLGTITLTLDYTPPVSNPGTITLNKTSMLAGETVGISLSTADAGVTRSIQAKWGSSVLATIVSGKDSTAGSYTYTFPMGSCGLMPNSASGTLSIVMTGSVGDAVTKNVTINVPADVLPTIEGFTAELNSNGVDASITEYVQNYSKVDLEVVGASGALGSTISAYEIIGGGWSGDEALEAFGPFSQSGDITFTAKVTDTRGRTVTGSVTINVLPYTPVSAVSISAFRSDSSGDPDDEGTYAALKGKRVYSLLGGENSATIRGRVFEKGTTPSSWSSMTDDTALMIGSLSIEKGYTAHIAIEDKVTSVVYVIEIPTSIVGIHIVPGATGGGFGMYGVSGRWDFSAPIFSTEGACPGIGDILYTLNPTHPAIRYPGTTWAAHEGVFLLGADETYEAGDTGGSATLQLGLGSGYAKIGVLASNYVHLKTKAVPTGDAYETYISGTTYSPATNAGGRGTELGGTTDSGSILPPFLSVYIWERTA